MYTANKAYNHRCDNCGKEMYVKPYRFKRSKRICCSLECSNKLRKEWFKGENNHQYGLKRDLNPTYIGHTKKMKNGYIFIRDYNHPFADTNGWVREHRVVAEKYLLNDENSIVINGKKYLSPDFHVHHKNHNKTNNSIDNLEIVTASEHTTLHNLLNPIDRDEGTGRFMSINKCM